MEGDMRRKVGAIGIILFLVTSGFVAILNFGCENAQAPPTFVSGTVYDGLGGPWTLAGSPYIVIGDVTVPAGQTLTIEPGVEVKFDGGFSIYVWGNLTAVGTETNRITITSNKAMPAVGDWFQIRVNSQGNINIKYSDMSYSWYGIYLWSSTNNIITNNNLSNNQRASILTNYQTTT